MERSVRGQRRRAGWAGAVVAALILTLLPGVGGPASTAAAAPARPTAPAQPSSPARPLAPSEPTPRVAEPELIHVDGLARDAVIVRGSADLARSTRHPVRIRIGGDVTGLVVRLNGHPITGRRGTYVLGGRQLQLGVNQLWVEATIRGRSRPAVTERRFYLGYRAPGLLTGSVVQGTDTAPAAVARLRLPAGALHRIGATLNGRAVDIPLRRGTVRDVEWNLGQAGRLQPGTNRLRVEVLGVDGRVGELSRTFSLDRRRPLVVARLRTDRPRVGSTVVLDTLRTPPSGGRPETAVHWTLLRRPLLSSATLAATGTSGRRSTASFRPDVPGLYRIGVRIGSGATAGYDVLEVTALYPNPLVPFDTISYPNGGTTPTLQIGNQTKASPGQAIAVYTVARASTEILAATGFAANSSGYSALAAYLGGLNDSVMAVITLAGAQAPFTGGSQLDAALAVVGANQARSWGFVDGYCWTATPNKCAAEGSHWVSSSYDTSSFSVIGVPGMAAGQAWRATAAQTGVEDGRLHGWLTLGQTDQSGYSNQYTVIPGTDVYRQVETCATDACNVQVGGQTYAPTAGVRDGMHVVVLNRSTLQPYVNKTVTSLTDLQNAIGAGWSPPPGTRFTTSPMLFDDQRLVILQSIGTGALSGKLNFIHLSLIDLLGGTTETFATSIDGTHAYALIGAATNMPFHGKDGLESSTVMSISGGTPTRATGRLSGVISPNRQLQYTPRSADPIGPTNNDLYPILYQPAQAWPYADQTDLLSYIATNLGFSKYPDVRSAYTDTNYKYSWGGFLSQLMAMTCSGPSFCAQFPAVQAELELEFRWVPQVLAFVDNMESPSIQSGSDPYFNIMAVTNQVSAAVPPPPSASTGMDFLSVFTDSLFVGDAIASAGGLEAEPFIGLLASSLSMATDLVQTPDGGSTSTVNATAAQLAGQLATQQTASLQAMDQVEDILLSDYGRLHDVGVALGGDPSWTWDTGVDTPAAVDTLNATARSSAYTALVPLSWSPYALKPGSTETTTNDPTTYVCKQGGDSVVGNERPFASATTLNSLQMASAPTSTSDANAATTLYEVWVLANLPAWDYDHVQSTLAPDSLLTDIYGPESTGPSGAFQYQPAWWHTTYPVPNYVVCNVSGSFNQAWSQHYAPPRIPLPLS